MQKSWKSLSVAIQEELNAKKFNAYFFHRFIAPYMAMIPMQETYRQYFLELLQDVQASDRHHYPDHITCSSVVLNEQRDAVLLLYHCKLQEWVSPGGHADGSWYWLDAAARECFEETGIDDFEVEPCGVAQQGLPSGFNEHLLPYLLPRMINRFLIPQHKDVPQHVHWDASYLFLAKSARVSINSRESEDWRWVPIAELWQQVQSGERMVNSRSLLTAKITLDVIYNVSCS